MSSKKLIIFGCGQAAELAHFYFTRDTSRKVAGFTVDPEFIRSENFCGLPVIAFDRIESTHPPASHDLFVAVGYSQLNQLRARKVEEARAKGYALASYCSRQASVLTEAPLEENCFVVEGSILQPFCRLGRNVTILGGVIGHHCVIADNCFVAGYLAGGVQVGPNCFIGVSALIRDQVSIGEGSIIGIGSLVLEDIPPYSVVRAAAAAVRPGTSRRLRRR